jgi:uncharacterized membrane protein (UPF0182 family)
VHPLRDFLRRRLLAVILVVVVLLLLSANRLATILTDWWWYRAVGAGEVFTGVIGTRILLGVLATLGLALLIGVNLHIARRLRPLVVPSTPQQAIIETYRAKADPYLPWLIAAVALTFGISSGVAAATQWQPFLLWRNGGAFGTADPTFGKDIGFYVFDLPVLHFVQGWLFTSLVLVLLLTAGAHLLLGGIRPDAPRDKVIPSVKAHLSVLLALVLAARGWGYWLDRYELNFSPRGTVTGASYTDINAELPALYLLLAVTGVAVVLTLVNLRRRGFLLPGAAIGLLVLASLLLQGVYPAAVQRLQVDPQELAREREYIERNQEATRAAYGLGGADLSTFTVTNDLSRAQVDENEVTIDNVRLWDPGVLETTYAELQELRTYYAFADVDVDRYTVDGQLRQVMLSVRELQQTTLPDSAQTWQNLALTYTHGLGVVASAVNIANSEGQPVFLASNIPTEGIDELVPEQGAIYYGETDTPDYSIVNTDQPELDYEESGTSEQVTTRYAGEGGVVIGNRLSRLAYALRFGDPNIVLSSLPRDESKILYHRDIVERVRKVAPYLALDGDPYPVVQDGRVVWVVDGYTTSSNYPYSERRVFQTGATARTANYVRNSVKATVDAYDGTVTLYEIGDDPVVQAWRRAFPGRFADLSEAPEGIESNFRYPQDMFELQAELYSIYHIPGPNAFYSRADAWDIPRDAAALQNNESLRPEDTPMEPYYLLMRLPGQEQEEFVLIQPYLARERPNMIAWLAGRSDPANYGDLFAVQFPSNQTILGPQQAQARIEQNDVIAEYITLRDQAGSDVIRGNMLVIPIEESILYVQPLFLENPQAQIPQLERVVLVMGDRVVMERTLEQAIAALLGEDVGDVAVPDTESSDPDAEVTEEQLVQRALDAFEAADQALAAGELGEYQRQIDRAQAALEQLADLRGVDVPDEQPTNGPTDGATEGGTEQPTDGATEADGSAPVDAPVDG